MNLLALATSLILLNGYLTITLNFCEKLLKMRRKKANWKKKNRKLRRMIEGRLRCLISHYIEKLMNGCVVGRWVGSAGSSSLTYVRSFVRSSLTSIFYCFHTH